MEGQSFLQEGGLRRTNQLFTRAPKRKTKHKCWGRIPGKAHVLGEAARLIRIAIKHGGAPLLLTDSHRRSQLGEHLTRDCALRH